MSLLLVIAAILAVGMLGTGIWCLIPTIENIHSHGLQTLRGLAKLEATLMSISDDINAKLDAAGTAMTEITTDLQTLVQLVQAGQAPDGSIPPDQAQAILNKATALSDRATAAAGIFPGPSPSA